MGIIIREIQERDNKAIAGVIRNVLFEHNVPKVGTAYADASLDCMFETYSIPDSAYFVIEKDKKIVGGAGIAALEDGPGDTCELQKMYFLKEVRGLGLGSEMMQKCLEKALLFNYQKCYLETMPYMKAAQKLYRQYGFEYLDAPIGNTGHSSCPVWMIKQLK